MTANDTRKPFDNVAFNAAIVPTPAKPYVYQHRVGGDRFAVSVSAHARYLRTLGLKKINALYIVETLPGVQS